MILIESKLPASKKCLKMANNSCPYGLKISAVWKDTRKIFNLCWQVGTRRLTVGQMTFLSGDIRMIKLNELTVKCMENAQKRQKNGANIKTDTRSMIKHCATEVVEAMEAYSNWSTLCDSKPHFESELADIICCVLIIAGQEQIDIEKAVLDCIEKNSKRAEGMGDKL